MPTPTKKTAALATLIGAAGIVIGTNWDKVVVLLGPTTQGMGKAAGATYSGALRFLLQQKESLEDKVAEVSMKTKKEVQAATQDE